MTKDEALKMALEALERTNPRFSEDVMRQHEAITAIREALNGCQCQECQTALHASDCAVHNEPAYPKGQCNCGAQPEQEPVAKKHEPTIDLNKYAGTYGGYTAPPQRKPPQFPTMLRKMWSGAEVQKWINENWSKT